MEDENSDYTQHHSLELNKNIPLVAAFIENLDEIIKFIGESTVN